jgi:hypothetical protein
MPTQPHPHPSSGPAKPAAQPQPQPKPQTPPAPPKPPEQPKPPTPPHAPPEGGKAGGEFSLAKAYPPPIGGKPSDPKDPQAAKFEAHVAPPRWDENPKQAKIPEEWTPEPALDPLAEKPPANVYVDGMTSADEQRARAAWVEEHGLREHQEAIDQRPAEDRPQYQKDALAGGGAFVSAGAQSQVPGVAPPAKRS